MKNKRRAVLFAGLFVVMGLLLALSLVMLINVPTVSLQSQQALLKNMRGLDRLELKASGSTLPLSTFSVYDQTHGTSLYKMANQLPSISASQLVAPVDFEQMQIAAEKQLGERSHGISWCWGLLHYLFVVAVIIITPIWAKLLTNFTDDYIYPLYKEAIKRRIDRQTK